MTTSTIPVVRTQVARELAAPTGGVSGLDRLAMRIGLALLLWGRRRSSSPRRVDPRRPELAGDPRWYMH